MNMQNYNFLSDQSTVDQFADVLDFLKLDKYNISYISLGIKDYNTNSGILLTPSNEWKLLVDKNKYYNTDPIFKAAALTKQSYLFYSRFNYNSEFEKVIYNQRKNLEITKGIMKIQHFENFRVVLTFSTNYSKFDELDFICRHHHLIDNFQNRVQNLIKTKMLSAVTIPAL